MKVECPKQLIQVREEATENIYIFSETADFEE